MAVDDSYTKVLLHMNGDDASTTFTDESGKSWTRAGDAQIDTAQFKFGGASGLFDGNSAYLTIVDNAELYPGASDFTIDMWFRKNAHSAVQVLYGQCNSGYTEQPINLYADQGSSYPKINFTNSSSELIEVTGSSTITDTNWHHFAAVRYGNTLTLYIDGISKGTGNVTGMTMQNSSAGHSIGRPGDYTFSQYMNGWIDEFRFSNGIARWTSNFTPPTSEYGVSGGTVIIWS